MMPDTAQYLLRFDDLCPTMDRERWEHFVPLIQEFGIRPILAVVPENTDRELKIARPDPAFWERMRAMETSGATIASHGYRHVCASRGKSLVPLHRHSEFAGVTEDTQCEWICAGLNILRGRGLNPTMFVAPRHGFDENTLRGLSANGIGLISDGFARVLCMRGGLIWIPQQLWAPVEKSEGLWTICIHSNTADSAQVDALRRFLEGHASQFTSVERVLREWKPMQLNLTERIIGAVMLGRVQLSRFRSRLRRDAIVSGGS
jgi:predicted deacetylase